MYPASSSKPATAVQHIRLEFNFIQLTQLAPEHVLDALRLTSSKSALPAIQRTWQRLCGRDQQMMMAIGQKLAAHPAFKSIVLNAPFANRAKAEEIAGSKKLDMAYAEKLRAFFRVQLEKLKGLTPETSDLSKAEADYYQKHLLIHDSRYAAPSAVNLAQFPLMIAVISHFQTKQPALDVAERSKVRISTRTGSQHHDQYLNLFENAAEKVDLAYKQLRQLEKGAYFRTSYQIISKQGRIASAFNVVRNVLLSDKPATEKQAAIAHAIPLILGQVDAVHAEINAQIQKVQGRRQQDGLILPALEVLPESMPTSLPNSPPALRRY